MLIHHFLTKISCLSKSSMKRIWPLEQGHAGIWINCLKIFHENYDETITMKEIIKSNVGSNYDIPKQFRGLSNHEN